MCHIQPYPAAPMQLLDTDVYEMWFRMGHQRYKPLSQEGASQGARCVEAQVVYNHGMLPKAAHRGLSIRNGWPIVLFG